MKGIFKANAADDAGYRASELMAILGVLIVAALIFASAGIREGRAQPATGASVRASVAKPPAQSPMLRRLRVAQYNASTTPLAY